MSKLTINIGSAPNSKNGDSIRDAFAKVNSNFTELYNTASADVQIPPQTDNVGKYLTTNGTALSWATGTGGTTDYNNLTNKPTIPTSFSSLVNGLNNVTLNATGALVYPNSALQRDTGTVSCPGNASTVVYTGSAPNQQTIKLLIQVEGSAPGNPYDTQACEMIIAKSFRANAIAASVYGVVHTSVAPLATFTAEWNSLINRVEVFCTTTAIAVSVRTFATEITTAD